METNQSQSPPSGARRRGWLRRLCWLVGVLVVLLVIAGFAVTSSAFFKGVILPRVSAAMNADITVSGATIRPFSRLELRDLEVKPRGRETLLTAREIRLRYDLMAILRGNLVVSEVVLESPSLQVVQQADGTSNLDPLLGAQPPEQEPAPAPEPGVEGGSPRIDVKRVVMSDATFRWIRNHAGGRRDLSESSAVRLVLEDLKNGGAGKLEVGGVIQVDLNPPAPGTNALLQAAVEGGFRFELAPDLRLSAVQGDARIEVRQAGGALGDLNALRFLLACDWSPTEIRELTLRLQRAGVDLAAMTLTGPFDAAKGEGRVRAELWGVDRQLLNLVGAPWGAQFNDTKLASTNQFELSQGGGSIAASGRFIASDFSVTQTGQTTPEFDFATEFDLTLNQSVLELRTARLNLAPTPRASNQIDASGRIDLTDPEAITGKLRFAADTLDATAIYDAWEAAAPAPGSTVPTDSTVPAADAAKAELEARFLPFRDFVCEVEIGRFWLREVEMTNWQTRLRLDGGRMVVDLMKLNLNGAQVDGVMDFNLGVAGAEYDLKLNADRIPVEPLVNSFLPEYRGQAKGDLFGQVQVKGAGTTDASLRRNLSGRNSLSLTNAAIQTAVLTNLFGVLERSSSLYVRTAWRLLEPTSIPFKMLSPLLTR
ncbi:MAG: AsmA family protein, partial [Verrucomicrobia bacterium]|nr:AsmA family protein [Verrucomicrobiota bacterium]